MIPTHKIALAKTSSSLGWLLVALGAHTGWGLYPVFARYLQTVSHVPTFALIALGNIIVLVFVAIFYLPHIPRRVYQMPVLWLFAAAAAARSITNVLASRYTLAIYVQLIGLLTPFFVALLGKTFLKERTPRFTGVALTLSTLGSALMIGADADGMGLTSNLREGDWLGILLALASTIFLAIYMVLIRRSAQKNISSEAILATQIITLTIVMGGLSVSVGENWGSWLALTPSDWAVFITFVVVALFGANIGQISALKHISASLLSSVMPWRMVSALAGGFLLLGERFTSPWQVLGALIVVGTVTWYLWQQQTPSKPVPLAE